MTCKARLSIVKTSATCSSMVPHEFWPVVACTREKECKLCQRVAFRITRLLVIMSQIYVPQPPRTGGLQEGKREGRT
jgi:hypothetical protein